MMIDALQAGVCWEDGNIDTWNVVTDMAGGWLLYSSGPDLTVESPGWISVSGNCGNHASTGYNEKRLFHEYDPTNGTVSYGNIFRTQKNPGGLGTREFFYNDAETSPTA